MCRFFPYNPTCSAQYCDFCSLCSKLGSKQIEADQRQNKDMAKKSENVVVVDFDRVKKGLNLGSGYKSFSCKGWNPVFSMA